MKRRLTFLWATAILLVLTTAATVAQSTVPYELTWLAFANGGTASGDQYEVAATLGQLDNGQLRGGDYDLTGRLGNGGATATSNPTPVATSTPVAGGSATPTPLPPAKLYLPEVRR